MFKIGEFSQIVRVSTRMLRHSDKLGLLTPNHTDPFTGYRYYTVEQIPRLHRIVALNGVGLTLQQIAALLGEDNELPVDQLRGMLSVRQAALEQELHEKQLLLASVAARLAQLEMERDVFPYEIAVKPIESFTVAGIRTLVPTLADMDDYCRHLYDRLAVVLPQYVVPSGAPALTIFHNNEYTEVDLDVEMAIPIVKRLADGTPIPNDITIHTLPGAETAATLLYHHGPYRGVETAALALLTWIGRQGYALHRPLREVHLSGPAHFEDQTRADAVVELQAPLRAINRT
jgi:DNA-binding transcriptional MerR regulator